LITLNLPSSQSIYFHGIGSGLVGPKTSDGSISLADSISARSVIDHLDEARGLSHENFVSNTQLEGTFDYVPLASEIVAAPVAYNPDQITIRRKAFSGSTIDTGTYAQGLAQAGKVSLTGSSSQSVNRLWEEVSESRISYVDINVFRTQPTIVTNIKRTEYILYKRTDGFVGYDTRNTLYSTGTNGIVTSSNWNERQSGGIILDMIAKSLATYHTANPTVGSWQKNGLSTKFRQVNPISLSPSAAFAAIDSFIIDELLGAVSPLKDVPYGDIAMDASSQVNATSINMIAFLRDIRHPQEMIPKLKNLRKLKQLTKKQHLKELSNDFLTVKYGILPTISDLQELLGTFKRIQPHLDRNGNSTYSASRDATGTNGDILFDLKQRVKLAIGNEDNGFDAIASGLERFGLLPNAEVIWDLIPYSFVLDWFINIGDFLERVDTRERLTRLNISYATSSRKEIRSKNYSSTSSFPYSGTAQLVQYQRWVSDQCPVPSLLSDYSTSNPLNHWLEGSALIIQRKK
jgi:hypothetical protein